MEPMRQGWSRGPTESRGQGGQGGQGGSGQSNGSRVFRGVKGSVWSRGLFKGPTADLPWESYSMGLNLKWSSLKCVFKKGATRGPL